MKTLAKALEDITDLINIQSKEATVPAPEDYMVGLANGLLIGRSCIDGNSPEFFSCQKRLKEVTT